MSSQEEIISTLVDFGLERDESMLYLALTQAGSATVNTISAKLGVDKGKIYRSLHKLQNLGLVATTFSNPTICQAIDPEEALLTILERKNAELQSIQKTIKKVAKEISQFKNPHDSLSQSQSLYIIQGRPNIYARIGKLIEESFKTVYIVTTSQDLMRMYYTAMPEKIKASRKNGAKIRIITDSDISYESLNQIKKLGADEIRLITLPSKSRMVLSENERLLMSGFINDSMSLTDEIDSSLYTNSLEIINNIHFLCEHLWAIAAPVEIKSQIR